MSQTPQNPVPAGSAPVTASTNNPHGAVDTGAANKKGLSSGKVTLFSSMITGISVVAPAYSLSSALGSIPQ